MTSFEQRKTLVLGASTNPDRYSYKAVEKLVRYGYNVVAIGVREGSIGKIKITTEKILVSDIDTVAMYLSPARQEEYMDYVISLKPRRIIFNPGTENAIFAKKAKENGIKTYKSCVLVMLSLNKY
ncbi:MAG: CoA-binding protein [Bacteroidia bacterium]|nr:CoA-binding protein [Bacteroidia bacterium]